MSEDQEQLELWSPEVTRRKYEETERGRRNMDPNPLVTKFGFGPPGETCKSCAHLFCHQRANRYYKCRYRKFTFGAGSDHRVRWNACSLFSRLVEEIAPEVLN